MEPREEEGIREGGGWPGVHPFPISSSDEIRSELGVMNMILSIEYLE
jgi:hypothetical protein